MQGIGSRPKLHVSADGAGVVGHAGARLLADLADVTGLTSAYSTALRPLRPHGTGHDPDRIATDLAVMVADGGKAITDLAVLRDQGEVFGLVASTPTAWRLLAAVDKRLLDRRRSARAQAREVAVAAGIRDPLRHTGSEGRGREAPGLVLDIDATRITCHSKKDQAAPTYIGGFGFHPLLCFLANTGEGMSGSLRSGNAGANTAADHIAVLDDALWTADSQLPNPRDSATGSCTSPPGSPAAAGASAFGYRRLGPGDMNSQPRSNAWPHCPAPPADSPSPLTLDARTPENPTPRRDLTMPSGRHGSKQPRSAA